MFDQINPNLQIMAMQQKFAKEILINELGEVGIIVASQNDDDDGKVYSRANNGDYRLFLFKFDKNDIMAVNLASMNDNPKELNDHLLGIIDVNDKGRIDCSYFNTFTPFKGSLENVVEITRPHFDLKEPKFLTLALLNNDVFFPNRELALHFLGSLEAFLLNELTEYRLESLKTYGQWTQFDSTHGDINYWIDSEAGVLTCLFYYFDNLTDSMDHTGSAITVNIPLSIIEAMVISFKKPQTDVKSATEQAEVEVFKRLSYDLQKNVSSTVLVKTNGSIEMSSSSNHKPLVFSPEQVAEIMKTVQDAINNPCGFSA